MLRKLALSVLAVLFLSMTTFAFAADVYITAKGKKYHKEICRFIKNRETTKIDDADAVKQGLVPCQKCFKEDVSAAETKKNDNRG